MYDTAHPPRCTMLVDQSFRRGDLHGIRATVAAHANHRGVLLAQIDKLVLIVSELVVNAVFHGGGGGTLKLWWLEDRMCCQVSDEGPGMTDLRVGMIQPPPGIPGGRGLWVVRSLSERVDIRTGPAGTTVTACVTSG